MRLKLLRCYRWWIEFNLTLLHERECAVATAIGDYYRQRRVVDRQIDELEYRETMWEDTQ